MIHRLLLPLAGSAFLISLFGATGPVLGEDLNKPALVHTFRKRNNTFRALAVSPGSEYVVAGSDLGKVYVWKLQTGKWFKSLSTKDIVGAHVHALAVTPDEDIVVGGVHHALRAWDLDSGDVLYTVPEAQNHKIGRQGYSGDVRFLSLDRAGRFIVSGGGKTLKVWSTYDGTLVKTHFERSHKSILDSVVTPDGRHVALATKHYTKVLERKTMKQKHVFQYTHHSKRKLALAFGGRELIVGGDPLGEKALRIFRIDSGEKVQEIPMKTRIRALAVPPGKKRVVVLDDQDHVAVINRKTETVEARWKPHDPRGEPTSLALDPSGEHIVTGSSIWTVKVWKSPWIPE